MDEKMRAELSRLAHELAEEVAVQAAEVNEVDVLTVLRGLRVQLRNLALRMVGNDG